MYALRNNSSTAMKYTATGAGVLALTTATLRILAGKHYPSDVFTGILFGAGVSMLNWQLRGL
jgi:membrane-associated phospholipid phosphatase